MIGALGRFIGKRVSRRLFALFVLSAFLPLAAIAFLSLSQVRSLLLQQGAQRLSAMAKSYGMTLFERLVLASEVAAARADSPPGALAANSLAARTFLWLAEVGPGRTVAVIGEPPAIALPLESRRRLESGKPVVVVTGETGHVRIAVAIDLPQRPGSMMIGELSPVALWGPVDELPAATGFCVIEDGSRRTLYCSDPIPAEAQAALRTDASAGFASANWTRDGSAFRSRAWNQFLRAGFGTPDWIVVASQPEQYQLARVLEFRNMYIPVVALTLLLVTWLTVRQARNIADPMELLAARARGIANNDFASRLDLKREDEFGELAEAFDGMSVRLGRQFASLTTLSEIDRLILSTQDPAQVVRTVLTEWTRRLPRI